MRLYNIVTIHRNGGADELSPSLGRSRNCGESYICRGADSDTCSSAKLQVTHNRKTSDLQSLL